MTKMYEMPIGIFMYNVTNRMHLHGSAICAKLLFILHKCIHIMMQQHESSCKKMKHTLQRMNTTMKVLSKSQHKTIFNVLYCILPDRKGQMQLHK